MSRIAPLTAPYESTEIEKLVRSFMPGDADGIEPLALFRLLAVHPELCSRMRPLGAGILAHGLIEPREREIVIHRTCARAGAGYEWGVHAAWFGPRVGLSEAQLAASAVGGPDDPAWSSEGDALLIALVDELHDGCTVSDELWAALAARYSPAQLLELLITAGWYRLLAYVINACGVTKEPWAVPMPTAGAAG
jgi:4-carboxymuconolactone decarboxylase